MEANRKTPDDPLDFIHLCVRQRKVLWTYHVNMRLQGRYISRADILNAVDGYKIIEAYPEDKYLPSYLVLATLGSHAFHVLFATEVEGDNIRVVTAYRPDPEEWETDLRTRRGSK